MLKKCLKCGKKFHKKPSHSKTVWAKTKYCSHECGSPKQGEYRTCPVCGKEFYAKRAHIERGYMVHCSISCSKKGKIPSNLKIAQANSPIQKGNTIATCLKGRKRSPFSEEWLQKIKEANREKGKFHSRENHWNWKGGITEENHRIRNSTEYREWRIAVFRRDHFACIKCGYRSKEPRDIVADHIKPFYLFPESRFAVSNGRTLCRKCDSEIGFNNFRDSNKETPDICANVQ